MLADHELQYPKNPCGDPGPKPETIEEGTNLLVSGKLASQAICSVNFALVEIKACKCAEKGLHLLRQSLPWIRRRYRPAL